MLSFRARVAKGILRFSVHFTGSSKDLATRRRRFEQGFRILFPPDTTAVTGTLTIAGIKLLRVAATKETERTVVYLHGGGFALGSTTSYQPHMARLARLCNAEVFGIEYGLSPEHPYPIALNQVKEVWRELIRQGLNPEHTAIMGDSAGANLALAATLLFRQTKLAQPGCIVLISPSLDATFSGISYVANRKKDILISGRDLHYFLDAYARGHDRHDPLLSPVFADLRQLPPTLVHAGDDEILLSDSETLVKHATDAGTYAELYEGKGMWHIWHLFAGWVPEAKSAMQAIATFVTAHT
ncbi:MAG TPA: alpha/beta hydrolase [Candidatus Saccharimonadales bacterium]